LKKAKNVQILEVVRLEGQPLTHDEVLFSRDIDMLQVRILTTLHFMLAVK
jgi:hypothetical protein